MDLTGWTGPDRGALFVLTGPSGVGKSTLVHAVMDRIPGLEFSVSATTRAPRSGEVDGVDYHFLDAAEFAVRVGDGAFLEHATVYGRSYGTLREPVDAALSAGRSVVLDIDLDGARHVRRAWPGGVHVMILPPDLATLQARLRARATDSEEIIAGRMDQVAEQLAGVREYDYLLVNDHLPTAVDLLAAVVLAELSRTERRGSVADRVEREVRALR